MYDISSLCCTHKAQKYLRAFIPLQGVNGSWAHRFGTTPIKYRGGRGSWGTNTSLCATTSWGIWDLRGQTGTSAPGKPQSRCGTNSCIPHPQVGHDAGKTEGIKEGFSAPLCSLEVVLQFPATGKPQHMSLRKAQHMSLKLPWAFWRWCSRAQLSHHQDRDFLGYFPTTGATGNCTGHSRCSSCESVAGWVAGEEEIPPCWTNCLLWDKQRPWLTQPRHPGISMAPQTVPRTRTSLCREQAKQLAMSSQIAFPVQ